MLNIKEKKICIIVLIAIGFLVYVFNLNNGLFWDDDDWILNNTFVHAVSWTNIKFWFTHNTLAGVGMKSNYYRPLLFFTFAVNYVISGAKPLSYHLFSNLIHIANGILVFSILYLAFRKKWAAFITALIFLIHPLQTEAVTYISGRGDLLVVFFMLLALWLFIKNQETANRKYQVLSIISLVPALLSRETAIIFPFLLVIFYASFLSQTKLLHSLRTGFIKVIPYLGIVLVYGILRLTVLNFLNTLNFYAVHNVYADHLYVRMLTFAKVLLVYFKLLLIPVGLHMERGMDPQLSFWVWPVWFIFLLFLGLISWLIFLYRKGKNDDFRVWFFGASWFFIGLAPVSGITPINAILYEHWLYLPIIGFFFVISFYLDKILYFFKEKKKPILFWLIIILLLGYFVFFGAQSIKRNILWGKPINFYSDILKYEPDSVRINNNIGNFYFNQGETERALEFYQKAVATEDIFPQPHFNLGSILQSKGDIYGAIQEYEKAIKIDPNFYYPYYNLVTIYARQGSFKKASDYVTKLDELKPNDSRVLYNAALIYAAEGNFDLAVQKAEEGLVYVGSDQEVKNALEKFLAKFTKKE